MLRSDGAVGTVLALSGGYLVPPTTVVPFRVGGCRVLQGLLRGAAAAGCCKGAGVMRGGACRVLLPGSMPAPPPAPPPWHACRMVLIWIL